jgi:hypothetical protein
MAHSNIKSTVQTLDHIDVDIHATHLNYVNGNSLYYRAESGTKGAPSWIEPFGKPQLVHHAAKEDAIGRIIDFNVLTATDDLKEPNDVIKLKARITDKDAMEKVLNGIYFTCSVGSKSTKVTCSECKQVLTEEGLCEHEKGERLDSGKSVYWIIDDISYRENSFVNKPADPYSRIVAIDIGYGAIPYKEFLDHRETLINELTTEDSFMDLIDGKLSTSARKKLPDKAFCGPGRSFPAHDKAHVTAGLRLLNKSKFSASTKTKIKSCLYRKGKLYGITPSKDELDEYPNMLTYRIDDDFSDEELNDLATYFKENPDADLPEVETPKQEDAKVPKESTMEPFDEVKEKDKEDIVAYTEKLIVSHEDAIKKLDSKVEALEKDIKELKDNISDKDAILKSKEDEVFKLLDDMSKIEEKHRQALIGNIVDLQMLHNNEKDREELTEKYNSRQIHSLIDTISDLHTEITKNAETNKVDDPTLEDSEDTKGQKETEGEPEYKAPEGTKPELTTLYQKNWRNE